MENCTNCSTSVRPTLAGAGFGAFLILMFLMVVLSTVLNVTIITALCVAKSVARLMRIFLINLLVSGLMVALFSGISILSAIILNFSFLPPPDMEFCRFLIWGFSTGVVSRLYCLSGFSIIVLLIVRYNKKEMKIIYVVLFLSLIWFVSLLLNVHTLIPPIFSVQVFDNVICFPRNLDPNIIREVRFLFTTIWVIFGGFTPMTISIVIPIVVLCYVRRNTIAEESSYNKGIAKFALFLVCGNLVNIVGQTVVALIGYVSEPPGVYLSNFLALASLIPTPIMILIFMKPVRTTVSKLLCCAKIQCIPRISKVKSAIKTEDGI